MAFGPAAERAAAAPPPAAADEFLGFDTPAPACCSAFNGAANPFSAASAYRHAVNASPAGGAVQWGAAVVWAGLRTRSARRLRAP